MLTFVLIAKILAAPLAPVTADPPREGREAAVAPKPVMPGDPARRRAAFAGKVETAWLLADRLPGSEAEAGP